MVFDRWPITAWYIADFSFWTPVFFGLARAASKPENSCVYALVPLKLCDDCRESLVVFGVCTISNLSRLPSLFSSVLCLLLTNSRVGLLGF